jgi:hypothetical protein
MVPGLPSVERANSKDGVTNGGDEMGGFRWRSWLGASVILFLLYGGANMLSALAVPTTLIQGGAGATAVVLDPDSDAYLVGGK